MSLYLLDTNMVSFILSGRSAAARAKLASLTAQDTVGISAVTEGELYFGLAKSPNSRRRQALQQFLLALTVYPWNSEAAVTYGWLRAQLEKSGATLGPYDMQIAAQAMALTAVLVSHDKAFARIRDRELAVVDWATDLIARIP